MQRREWSFLKFLVADFIRFGLKWDFRETQPKITANKFFQVSLPRRRHLMTTQLQKFFHNIPSSPNSGNGNGKEGVDRPPGFLVLLVRC